MTVIDLEPRVQQSDDGAIDALANYWITRIDYETRDPLGDTDETPQDELYCPRALAEFNLEKGAHEAFFVYSKTRFHDLRRANDLANGWQIGFAFALALSRKPLDAETALRAVLDEYFPRQGTVE